MKKIVTISREFGAGGGEIGKIVASKLGFEYYDKEIILECAREANVSVETANRWDEIKAPNYGFAQSLFDFYNRSLDEKLFEAQSQVIKELGEKGNCVIVGRNANTILKHFDKTLHVFVSGDPIWRIERMKQKYDTLSKALTIKELETIDKRRKKYCSYYTNTEFGSADEYDLCISASRLGVETCADVIVKLANE